MRAQKPAKGVMKTGDNMFRINCECGIDDHSIEVWIEVMDDPEDSMKEIEVCVKSYTPFSSFWKRLKIAWNVIFKGYDEKHTYTILDKQAATNFAHILLGKYK